MQPIMGPTREGEIDGTRLRVSPEEERGTTARRSEPSTELQVSSAYSRSSQISMSGQARQARGMEQGDGIGVIVLNPNSYAQLAAQVRTSNDLTGALARYEVGHT